MRVEGGTAVPPVCFLPHHLEKLADVLLVTLRQATPMIEHTESECEREQTRR